MRQITLLLSPVEKEQTLMVSEEGKFTSTLKVETEDIPQQVFQIADIDTINLIGPKAYTQRFEERLRKYAKTKYSKTSDGIKYNLIER